MVSLYEGHPTISSGNPAVTEVITVWHEQQLIGLIRSVGDGETILYIQDLLVHPAYQNKGIGTQLIEKMVQAYPKVRQKFY